jgi:hypothetical protein
MDTSSSTPAHRRPTTNFATAAGPAAPSSAKVHDINYILGPSVEQASTTRDENAAAPSATAPAADPATPATPAAQPAEPSQVAQLLTTFSSVPRSSEAEEGSAIRYTPTTHRVSKAKKGKKVHVCEFGCGKVTHTHEFPFGGRS